MNNKKKKILIFLSPERVRVELKFKSYSQILNWNNFFFENFSKSQGGEVELKFKSQSQIMNCKKKIEKFSMSREGRTQIQILESNHGLRKNFFLKNFQSPEGGGWG